LSSLRKYGGVLLAFAAMAGMVAMLGRAQPQAAPGAAPGAAPATAMNRNLVVIDPAHGGPDAGATLGDHVLEKDVTLALAARLRQTLTAAGFTVVATRDTDSPLSPTTDQRAETANRARPVACVVIHATGSGSGVHVYTSALPPSQPENDADADTDAAAFVPVPWDAAQAGSVAQSLRLAGDLNAALGKANLPAVVGRAHVKPLDNMTCPAVALEMAPLLASGDSTPVTDPGYQQRVADTVAAALKIWRTHAEPAADAAPGGSAQ
jgi:N-acetylmuramoyl-L-alanine amidase